MSRFLAAFRASGAAARTPGAYSAGNPEKGENPTAPAVHASGGGGFCGFRDCRDHTPGEIAFLNAARAAAAALAEPDPDLEHERAEIAAALAAEADGDFGRAPRRSCTARS